MSCCRDVKTGAPGVGGQGHQDFGPHVGAALTAGFTPPWEQMCSRWSLAYPRRAYLTRAWQLDAGVMISASHNPIEDNGIKFFSRDGVKLPDEVEAEIDALIGAQPPAGGFFWGPRMDCPGRGVKMWGGLRCALMPWTPMLNS